MNFRLLVTISFFKCKFFCLFIFAYANINLSSTYMLIAPSSVTNQQYKHCGNKESVLLLEAMGETFSN